MYKKVLTLIVIVALFILAPEQINEPKKIIKKIIPDKEKTNLDRIIGMTGIVISKITKNKPGEVKVDGKIWTAISNTTINENEPVKILEINSTKLKVEKIKE